MPKGFAALTPERRKEIARKGGKRAHELGTAHRFNKEEAKEAGAKGGKQARGLATAENGNSDRNTQRREQLAEALREHEGDTNL